MVVEIMFLTEFYHIGLSFDEVVTRHCGEKTEGEREGVREGGGRKRGREGGRERGERGKRREKGRKEGGREKESREVTEPQ